MKDEKERERKGNIEGRGNSINLWGKLSEYKWMSFIKKIMYSEKNRGVRIELCRGVRVKEKVKDKKFVN